ncbi:hypothetical protein CORC01_04167 [Colletotrichum orchidophilum]|uniref:Ribosomal protein S21 n=1 Tax=Colletotrichum orchidophilum TaxID=1209926 RepID=A0A1G4BGH2_9PEZI|nr:uncharacterized protein CORC01_04167 [Colletotrichum orchidophilum]OHF00417.1 hypothetical protein CORC01_04167 [Colletotrichum orchidophilum]
MRQVINRASEIGFLSKRLLTTCAIRNPSVQALQAFRQPSWTHPRAFATSSILSAPPRSGPRSNLEDLFSKPSPTNYAQPPPPPPPSDAAAPQASQEKSNSPYVYDATSDTFDISKIIAMESDEFLKKHYPTSKQEPNLRTRPSTGRTIHLTGHVDLAKALRLLEYNCRKNKVKRTFQLQRFHERPGKKRKRMKSERWRNQFKSGFTATIKRVMELKNQGW